MADLKNISRLIEQGKVSEARTALGALPSKDAEVVRLRRVVRNLVLRKFQRQAKVEEFLAEAGNDPELRVAGGRLAGTLPQSCRDASSPFDALLVALATGDLRAELGRLRRMPGCAELAHGWMAVLRGDFTQAAAMFASVPEAQRRRAALGLGVVAALTGDGAGLGRHLTGLGPFPHTAFPALARLLQQMSRQAAEHGPASLAAHLTSDNYGVLQRAFDAWPKAQPESRGWLALRLGDLRWAESDGGDRRAVALWREAALLNPALLADAFKRLLLAFPVLKSPLVGTWQLYERLQRQDPGLARTVLDTISATWSSQWCVSQLDAVYAEIVMPEPTEIPVELLFLRFRAVAALIEQNTGEVKSQMKKLRPALERCDAAYPRNLVWHRTKLAVLGHVGQFNERRKACFAALTSDPACAVEILPHYLALARRDARVKRQVRAELIELAGILGDDPDLAILAVESGTLAVEEVAVRWTGPVAQAILLVASQAKPGGLPSLGQDEAIDVLACMAGERLGLTQLDCLLGDRDRMHRLLRRHQRRLVVKMEGLLALLRRWRTLDPQDWRPWYHVGACARLLKEPLAAEQAWGSALDLIPPETSEAQEMAVWLDMNQDSLFDSAEGSREFDFNAFFRDARDAEFARADRVTELRDFEKMLKELQRSDHRPPIGTPRSAPKGKPAKRPQPVAPEPGPTHPLLLNASAGRLFAARHGTAMESRMRTLIPSLGIGSSRDAAALADAIDPSERIAVCDWLGLLIAHNSRLHDLATASAIAVLELRLRNQVSQ